MASVMQSVMQSEKPDHAIADRIGNAMSDSMGNSHTPYSILHSPAEQVGDVTTRGVQPFDDFATPGAVIEAGELWRTETRHPRVRTGERDPIPPHLRAAVWYRDQGRCDDAPCPALPPGVEPGGIHLDHIKPWSAGGTDTTDNLRLLCAAHNIERSNFVDYARPKRAATWWCHRCHDLRYQYVGQHLLQCGLHNKSGYGGIPSQYCRVARAIERWQDATWFQVAPPEHYTTIAYCAHCNAPGLTGHPL